MSCMGQGGGDGVGGPGGGGVLGEGGGGIVWVHEEVQGWGGEGESQTDWGNSGDSNHTTQENICSIGAEYAKSLSCQGKFRIKGN